MNNLERQLNFIRELDRLKSVYRQVWVKSDNNRRENSAEHSWHLAMMAHILKDYVDGEVDINRVISMLLVHDVVEIDAGDTFAFADQDLLNSQRDRERKALERILGILPESQCRELTELWDEFDRGDTREAKFAIAIDRIIPLVLNVVNDGGSWPTHGIPKAKVLKRNEYLREAAPRLWEYVVTQVDIAVEKGWLLP